MKTPKRPPMKRALRAGSIAAELLSSRGYDLKLRQYRAWQVWERVVGPQIARHARPLRIRDSVLEVRVDQPVWMQQLRMMAPQILQRLNQALGEKLITDIYWRRGKVEPARNADDEHRPLRCPLTEEELERIRASLPAMADPELADAVLRARIRQAEYAKARRQAQAP
ncbi:uncharacterized protein DUF721 [Geothermobacter ehrlichii]|uniref:Uncharacterized protein DUF721 n=1 Tax=Geothermobacter ehrlichii TaxID=213224 RepID=A0A5D3WGN8_9BACT|nr:DUF721 domain-containing protein [Geothermobacter ehrlichii]TYO96067.1 uncharacterized protein DUF721 [Geothermobacter ehrlichii]